MLGKFAIDAPQGRSPGQSLPLDRKLRHNLLPVGIKSHKSVHFGSCLGHDFSLTVQPILKQFTVFACAIKQLYFFFLRNLLDVFAP